jgi:hypothetical protein
VILSDVAGGDRSCTGGEPKPSDFEPESCFFSKKLDFLIASQQQTDKLLIRMAREEGLRLGHINILGVQNRQGFTERLFAPMIPLGKYQELN